VPAPQPVGFRKRHLDATGVLLRRGLPRVRRMKSVYTNIGPNYAANAKSVSLLSLRGGLGARVNRKPERIMARCIDREFSRRARLLNSANSHTCTPGVPNGASFHAISSSARLTVGPTGTRWQMTCTNNQITLFY